MQLQDILSHVDHTLLRQTATWEEIQALCDQGIEQHVASVCIPPSYVRQASDYLGGRLPVCTVIGFPNGYNSTAVKVFETKDAIENGAKEIDMVVNLGWVKDGLWELVSQEISQIKTACAGHILKVIVEACLLTEAEKIKLCQIVSDTGADFIKTSTGFSSGGATVSDVTLFRNNIKDGVNIKAAGGIRTEEDAVSLLSAGADRLGSSALAQQR